MSRGSTFRELRPGEWRGTVAVALRACFCLAVWLMASPAQAGLEGVARFALVIGNNRAETSRNSQLRYADDDAVATHRLLTEAGVDSVLLVTLDEDSRQLYRGLGPHGAPREKDLAEAYAALSSRMRQAVEKGKSAELLLFYSGHGDVQDGAEGYVVLEDGRLTRSKLHDMLARSPAAHNHVFVDACRSYFLVFDRGPGGQRQNYAQPFGADGVPGRIGNTGFVLSTSSDRDSHEWERYQAGILSHELRSALRGAADADGDGRVTYAELGAFLESANLSIPNPMFRPDFLVRPPEQDRQQEVLQWNADPAPLRVDGSLGHIYVETALGERILDVHPEAQQALTLHVPAERPLFVRQNDEALERQVRTRAPLDVAQLPASRPEISRRGAVHLAFENLFATPFGRRTVAEFERRPLLEAAVPPVGGRPENGEARRPADDEIDATLRLKRISPQRFVVYPATRHGVPKAQGDASARSIVCYAVAGGRVDLGLDRALTGPFLVCEKAPIK